jgi:phosphohistidine phosphatase SixA
MKSYLLLVIILIFTYSCKNKEETEKVKKESTKTETVISNDAPTTLPDGETTILYLIRHAEEIRTNPNDKNPSLNVEGMNRARNWATYFERTRIDTLYINKYLPTRQTGTPISQQKLLKKTYYNPDRFDAAKFIEETKGKSVLIIGKRNEIPKIINSIIGEERFQEMADEDYTTLFKVTIIGDTKNVETIRVQ